MKCMEGENKVKKTLSCILSFLPMVLIISYIVISIVITAVESTGYSMGTVGVIFTVLALLIGIAGFILGGVLVIVYIVKTIKNNNLSVGIKVLWCWLLFQMSVFFFAILPIYWFVVLRKEQA